MTSNEENKLEEQLPDKFSIDFVREPEGGWFVEIPEFPGCMSQGNDLRNALDMMLDAIEGWLESFDNLRREDGQRN